MDQPSQDAAQDPSMQDVAQPAPQGAGPIGQMVMAISEQMQQLLQALAQTDAVPDEVKQAYAQLVQQFHQLVDSAVSGGPKAAQGNVPPEVGNAKATPAMF